VYQRFGRSQPLFSTSSPIWIRFLIQSNNVVFGLGTALESVCMERHEQALEAFNKSIELNPKSVVAHYNKGPFFHSPHFILFYLMLFSISLSLTYSFTHSFTHFHLCNSYAFISFISLIPFIDSSFPQEKFSLHWIVMKRLWRVTMKQSISIHVWSNHI
jgi:hypothetical protein